MEYLLDTANLEAIKKLVEYLPITGVASNPSIVKREGKIDFIGQNRTLHIQVILCIL